MRKERNARRNSISIDFVTIILVLALVTIGIVTILNVMAEPFTGLESSFEDIRAKINLEYAQRQLVNFMLGLAAAIIIVVIDYNYLKQIIRYVYIGNIVLLGLLLLQQIVTRGIMAWFDFGVRAFQPSEMCKVTLIIMLSYVASEIYEKKGAVKSLGDILKVVAYFVIPFVLVIAQPDFGTAVVYVVILACILFMSKISWKYVFGALAGMGIMGFVSYFYFFTDAQKKRIDVFLNPELDLTGYGMHVLRSKEAIGSGQMYGKGYFTTGTLMQLKYVPERHTDFIFSGIGEGFGFVGGVVVIALFFILIFRWIWVALKAKDHFGTCIVIGAVGMMLAHVFENIGMTIGLMPVTGIPLPFISYGGSNLLTNMMTTGLVLNVWMRRHVRR